MDAARNASALHGIVRDPRVGVLVADTQLGVPHGVVVDIAETNGIREADADLELRDPRSPRATGRGSWPPRLASDSRGGCPGSRHRCCSTRSDRTGPSCPRSLPRESCSNEMPFRLKSRTVLASTMTLVEWRTRIPSSKPQRPCVALPVARTRLAMKSVPYAVLVPDPRSQAPDGSGNPSSGTTASTLERPRWKRSAPSGVPLPAGSTGP